jgi:hypothetical protein
LPYQSNSPNRQANFLYLKVLLSALFQTTLEKSVLHRRRVNTVDVVAATHLRCRRYHRAHGVFFAEAHHFANVYAPIISFLNPLPMTKNPFSCPFSFNHYLLPRRSSCQSLTLLHPHHYAHRCALSQQPIQLFYAVPHLSGLLSQDVQSRPAAGEH